MSFDVKAHLKTMTEMHAPSGHEGPMRAYLREVWAPWADEFQVDGLGSLLATKRGDGAEPRPRIMLSAHMDEIALMVGEVRDGYARLSRIGGVDNRTLQAKSVRVHGQRELIGTVAAVPPHISNQTGDGRSNYLPLDEQWVDFGLPAEEVAQLVRVGDLVTLDAPMLELKGDKLAGKAMDDRASVAALSHCLHLLQRRLHAWDVVAVASTQEEVGLQGATTAAHLAEPDLAIAIDVTFAKQPGYTPDTAPDLGKVVPLGVGPNFHPGWTGFIEKIAKEIDIKTADDPISGRSGTDAWAIQTARQGVPTALISIPLRNMHSTVETLSLRDITRTGRLMAEVIMALDDDTLNRIAWDAASQEEG
ncbi:MAG: M28 family peptidase [Anaerolineales bacterium]